MLLLFFLQALHHITCRPSLLGAGGCDLIQRSISLLLSQPAVTEPGGSWPCWKNRCRWDGVTLQEAASTDLSWAAACTKATDQSPLTRPNLISSMKLFCMWHVSPLFKKKSFYCESYDVQHEKTVTLCETPVFRCVLAWDEFICYQSWWLWCSCSCACSSARYSKPNIQSEQTPTHKRCACAQTQTCQRGSFKKIKNKWLIVFRSADRGMFWFIKRPHAEKLHPHWLQSVHVCCMCSLTC